MEDFPGRVRRRDGTGGARGRRLDGHGALHPQVPDRNRRLWSDLETAANGGCGSPHNLFGNGIQDWAYAKARQQAGSADPWFFTTDLYTNRGAVKPVSVPAGDSYWESPAVLRHVQETFTEWKRRLLGASTQSGGGPDATGIGGGFDYWLREAITNAFGALKPLVSYEGGPSIYTDYLDSGDPRDAGITTFLELMNRQPQFRDVYRIHLNLAKAKGLRTHGAFVDVSAWGRYGQWGHLEYLDQPARRGGLNGIS